MRVMGLVTNKNKNFATMRLLFLITFYFVGQNSLGQHPSFATKRGSFYFYWGWNRAYYAPSTIRFHGNTYDFQLYDVAAADRQSPFSASLYLNPKKITVPQYNARIGYYFRNGLQLSLGVDHMKYVMLHDQPSTINGYIYNSGTVYDGVYTDQDFVISQDFLKFEHTDGLNYINAELRRSTVLFQTKYFQPIIHYGGGVGAMLPKTNTTLMSNPRYDAFHLAGYGVDGVFALQCLFFKYFFIQGEAKMGFIHMPDIRTTMHPSDRASQMILFTQFNVNFGLRFPLLSSPEIIIPDTRFPN
jgi:hypothetical protein